VLRDTGARLDRRGMRNPGWSPWRRVLANVLVGEGRSGEARELARESLRYAERFGTASARGAAHLAVAETLPANDPARLDHHQRAADLLATAPAPYERARAQLALGLALRAAPGREKDADVALRRALDTAESVSAEPLAEAARQALG
jgi:hypothetical protein